jgi:hypothetical protein
VAAGSSHWLHQTKNRDRARCGFRLADAKMPRGVPRDVLSQPGLITEISLRREG